MKNNPKLLKSLFNLTSEDKHIPTNVELDDDIEKVGFLMHMVWPLLMRIIKIKLWLFIKYKWKTWAKTLIYTIILVTAIIFAWVKVASPIFITQSTKQTIVVYKSDSTMNLHNFLQQIAFKESSYNPAARNSQFWGLWQIGDNERRISGYGDISWEVYKNHPEIQKMCILNLMKINRDALKKEIKTYSGKIVDGILMTESGIIALAQFGTGFASDCLKNGRIPEVDQYGNHPREYAVLGGYNLDLK